MNLPYITSDLTARIISEKRAISVIDLDQLGFFLTFCQEIYVGEMYFRIL